MLGLPINPLLGVYFTAFINTLNKAQLSSIRAVICMSYWQNSGFHKIRQRAFLEVGLQLVRYLHCTALPYIRNLEVKSAVMRLFSAVILLCEIPPIQID